jgi:selenocysteine lyase/cysteine desulfurase
MLPSQRALFDIPREVCYLNAAAFGPLPGAVREAGERGAARKSRPWELGAWQTGAQAQSERARAAAARLIGAVPDDVAVISSISYGVATAGRLLPVREGERVLVVEEDHSSPVLEWLGRAPAQGFMVEAVRRPDDCDWTRAVLAAITRAGAPKLAVVSISSVHWSDGGLIDLDRVAAAARAAGAALVVDATHHAGILPIDVRRLDPDFLMFPTYKWVLGPYGRAFLYVAKRWSRPALAGAASIPHLSPICAISHTCQTRAGSTWASASFSSAWKWRRSEWRCWPRGAPVRSPNDSAC